MRAWTLSAIVCALLLSGCATPAPPVQADVPGVPVLHPQVIAVLPHDRNAFTEGLEIDGGQLYESTGRVGTSWLQVSDPATGKVHERVDVPVVFGEGVTVLDTRIWQLTWRDGVAIERDRATLAELRRVRYDGEGWGLCHLPDETLVMSDGTDRLTFRDPVTFAPKRSVHVLAGSQPVTQLNELECTPDAVYANVWQTDTIVRIDPDTGRVTATIDLAGLLPARERVGTDVLNGIAAVPGTDQFLVTGKLWPSIFRVKFVSSG